MPDQASRFEHWRPVLWVFLIGVALRLIGLGEWSLWEDEETTIYFSYHPTQTFPRAFPTFFRLLGQLYAYTGCSVLAGRLLAAALGSLSLALTYAVVRRFAGPRIAVIALAIVAVSPGHLFWSQSIRYYGLALCLQLAGIWLLLEGLARRRAILALLSLVPIYFAVTAHISALLLVPVCALYLGWQLARNGTRRQVAATGAFFLLGTGILIAKWWHLIVIVLTANDAVWLVGSARDPVHVLATGVFYFGLPALALAVIGGWQQWKGSARREVLFFALLATVPSATLIGIATLNVVNVTYYYGLVSLVGVAVFAGYGAESLGGWSRPIRLALVGASVCYYLVVIGAYFLTSHGDRPRWREATAHLSAARAASGESQQIHAQVPGVVAFYLGVPPSQTMGHPEVLKWRAAAPPSSRPGGWYVTEERVVTSTDRVWLNAHCVSSARFPSRMLMRDRTVGVYRCVAD